MPCRERLRDSSRQTADRAFALIRTLRATLSAHTEAREVNGAQAAPVVHTVDARLCSQAFTRSNTMGSILWAIITVLFVFWLIGLVAHIGGGLIHILLVVALILIVYNLVTTGRAAI